MAWLPFCGNVKCPCMEPDPAGPCEEHKPDSPNPRCVECGWPKHRHLGPLKDAPPTGEVIQRALARSGLLIKDVAERTGLSTRHISNLLHGRTAVTLDVAMLLEEVIDLNALRLLNAQTRWQIRIRRRQLRDQRMAADWNDGDNVTTIAERYGLSVNWTGELLKTLGIDVTERAGNQGHLLDIDEDAVANAYNKGATIRAIAADWNVSYTTIHRILELRDDVTFRPRGTPKNP